MEYPGYVTTMQTMLAVVPNDQDFALILPDMINYAENRIQRDLDLLGLTLTNRGQLTANTRIFSLPGTAAGNIARYTILQGISVITPLGSTDSDGNRNPLSPVSRRIMDLLYPTNISATSPSIPVAYSMDTDTTIFVGPAPDAAYAVETYGIIRNDPLSASNPLTFISAYYDDLMIAASMVFGAGYQKNFGAMTDDPQMSSSWEQQYQKLLVGARDLEQRRRYNYTLGVPMK